jgi:hypothetical protein
MKLNQHLLCYSVLTRVFFLFICAPWFPVLLLISRDFSTFRISSFRLLFWVFDAKLTDAEYQLPTQLGRACSQSQLYIALGENQNKENVICENLYENLRFNRNSEVQTCWIFCTPSVPKLHTSILNYASLHIYSNEFEENRKFLENCENNSNFSSFQWDTRKNEQNRDEKIYLSKNGVSMSILEMTE